MVFDGRLVAYATSDHGEVADQLFTPGEDRWVALTDDPLPPSTTGSW